MKIREEIVGYGVLFVFSGGRFNFCFRARLSAAISVKVVCWKVSICLRVFGEIQGFGRLTKKRDKGERLSDKGVENGVLLCSGLVGPLRVITMDSGGRKRLGGTEEKRPRAEREVTPRSGIPRRDLAVLASERSVVLLSNCD